MPDVEQQTAPTSKQQNTLRNLVVSIFLILLLLAAALVLMFTTNTGSKFLLDRVLERQQIIQYQYEAGNLWRGIILRNVSVNLASVNVALDRADVSLGWRAILHKEIHLSRAEVNNLKITTKTPPSDEPFKFNEIRLPFELRVDYLDLDKLLIETATGTQVPFSDIVIHDALWSGTHLKFRHTQADMGYLAIKNASGYIDFSDKYPLNVVGKINLPALNDSLGIHDIDVSATGTLDTIQAGVATYNPDLLSGWVVVHPMRASVPMFGALKFDHYHLPFLPEQALLIEQGLAKFKGNAQGFDIDLNTDLSGKDIPKGQYQAHMSTDFVNELNIQQLTADVLDGTAQLAGRVGWKDQVTWAAKGTVAGLNRQHALIPEAIREFLPPDLDAKIASQGSLENGLHLSADVDFDRYEAWQLQLDQDATSVQQPKPEPMQLDVRWRNMNRAVPYVGWLNSAAGNAKIQLLEQAQHIQVNTALTQHPQGFLATGQYQADLELKDARLTVPRFEYQQGSSQLHGQAQVQLPTEQQPLRWSAQLNPKDFDPRAMVAALPIDRLNGQLEVSGYAQPNQQIIQLQNIQLFGRMAGQTETVRLTGQSTAALLFDSPEAGGAFKSFAVNYDGDLDASAMPISKGGLQFKLSGTPELLNIAQFKHDGIAGKILAQGQVNLADGIAWNLNSALVRFRPQYFVSTVKGEVSGNVTTQGTWSEKFKRIELQRLNIAGQLNGQPVRGQGNLALQLKQDAQGNLAPEKFEANQLYLTYANNQLQATGNAQQLNMRVDAPALAGLYPGLKGRVYGDLKFQLEPRLKATANLAVDQFAFNDVISIQKMRLQGELPTSMTTATVLTASLQGLNAGGREIQQGNVSLMGTYNAHVLKLQAQNRLSLFNVQLAGGFNAQNDWLGQIQYGDFNSLRTQLKQQQHAAVRFYAARQELQVGAHCWSSQNSELCLDQALKVSPSQGNVSLQVRNVSLSDFDAFMPEGLDLTGQVNGYAKAAWAQGQRPKLDARLLTENGSIGLDSSEENSALSKIGYERVALVAKSVTDGLQLRLDVKTKEIGTGYASVVIDPYSSNKAMRGEVAVDQVDLKIAKPFIQDVRSIGGNLSFAGRIQGSLQAPQFSGDLRLKDGAISMISLPVNLSNIQLYSSITQNTASINGAFNSGRGVGHLTGQVDWRNEPRIQLKLKGDDLLIRQAPLITAVVDPEFDLEVLPNSRVVNVNGKVHIPRALISMPEPSAPVVNVSSDVRIVREGEDQLKVLQAAKPWRIGAGILVDLGDQVIFQGFDSRIPLAGRVQLTQYNLETAMRAHGAIGISKRVKIEAYGPSLDLTRAIARFNGPLSNPTLDIDANKMVQGSAIGVQVTGTATTPNIQIYNDAGLSEQEALNALISGQINQGSSSLSQTAGFKSDVNNTIAAAGISMGLGGTRALTNQIGRSFGLSGLALDAQGTGDDTQVSVTGYITPDLFIRYGVGVFTPVNKLTLRYQMNQRVYLEASQSLERAIDMFYHWKF